MHNPQFRKDSITERYNLQEILGEGAFGKVVKARDKETNQTVAIKIISKKDLDSHEHKSVLTEINVSTNLNHPNIVKLVDVYDTPQAYMIVFEIMNGGELYDRICDKEQFTETEAASVLRPLVDALKYCHSQGVAHRDIKPENLLFEEEGDHSLIKVADFGMAKIVDNSTNVMSTVCGTQAYLAPEVISNQKYDFACDIWSLGVVLYVMLCGYPPFDSDSNEENTKNIKGGIFSFPSPDWDNVSENAKDLVRKMLTPDPKLRITADKILTHPWLVENSENVLNITEKLRKYNARRKLKKAGTVAFVTSALRVKPAH